MTTQTAESWLTQRGFQQGIGGRGTITVGWYNHGSAPNDGHMAVTLPDGSPAEAGGSNGGFAMKGSGANNPQFDHHMYLPVEGMYGENLNGPMMLVPYGPGTGYGTGTGMGAGGLGGASKGGFWSQLASLMARELGCPVEQLAALGDRLARAGERHVRGFRCARDQARVRLFLSDPRAGGSSPSRMCL
jgi:hypothetical protein